MDWKKYWNEFPGRFEDSDFVKQVGKTVHGTRITAKQVEAIVYDVLQKLQVRPQDRVLDLCCGNGLLTSAIAMNCETIIGVDFSGALIEVARKFHSPPNSRYVNLSVLDISAESLQVSQPFTKVLMYEALQYFQAGELNLLLARLLPLVSDRGVLLFASIPDKARLRAFYNTPQRWREYEARVKQGTEAIGTWWEQAAITSICTLWGLSSEFLPQREGLHTAHYRFDARIRRA